MFRWFFFFFCAVQLCSDPVKYATIAVLDKVTTKVQLFHLTSADEITVRGRIKVRVPACDAPRESSFYQDQKKCFVEIIECGLDGGGEKRIFSRWMIKDYPVVSAVDHARYDVWLFDCSAEEPRGRRFLQLS